MTQRSKNLCKEIAWSEFSEQIMKSRRASKDATQILYHAQNHLKLASLCIGNAIGEFTEVGEEAIVIALKNSIEKLANEENYLEEIINIIGTE